ncbi:MAG: hypothetical protein E7277_01400 [Lachnospiraceae bacterium]|jgi:hypothetical protein|nr:hypothetical protein [Lachnospiraceae bacterium]
MELEEILRREFEGTDVPYIEIRRTIPSPDGSDIDIMYGACQLVDGQLVSIDGDRYGMDTSCDKYYIYKTQKDKVIDRLPEHSEYLINAGTRCLVVWENTKDK